MAQLVRITQRMRATKQLRTAHGKEFLGEEALGLQARPATRARDGTLASTAEKMERTVEKVEQVARKVEESKGGLTFALGGEKNVELQISGQVSRALLFSDDGSEQEVFHVDNSNSSTRIAFEGTARPNEELTVGGVFDVEFESNPASDVNQNTENEPIANPRFAERKLEIYFEHDTWGTLWLGQGDTASDDSSEVDLSETDLILQSDIDDIGGDLLFRNTTTGALSGVEVGDVVSNLDGLGRSDRIRYDAPEFKGLTLSLGIAQGGENDVALAYEGEHGMMEIEAAIAYANLDSASTSRDHRTNGSISLLHSESGLSATFAAGRDSLTAGERDHPTFYYAKFGLQRNWFPVGLTALAVEYSRMHDEDRNGDEFRNWGGGAVQELNSWSTDLFAGVRNYKLDRIGAAFEEITLAMIGARFKF
jgi:predicted porin